MKHLKRTRFQLLFFVLVIVIQGCSFMQDFVSGFTDGVSVLEDFSSDDFSRGAGAWLEENSPPPQPVYTSGSSSSDSNSTNNKSTSSSSNWCEEHAGDGICYCGCPCTGEGPACRR